MSGEATAIAETIDGLFEATDRQDMDLPASLCAQDSRIPLSDAGSVAWFHQRLDAEEEPRPTTSRSVGKE